MATFSRHVVMHVIDTLTAVRATLSDDEQTFLDQLLRDAKFDIAPDEVEAQVYRPLGADKGANAFGPDEVEAQIHRPLGADKGANAFGPDEVEAQIHRPLGADKGANAFGPDEVEAQRYPAYRNMPNAPTYSVIFDPDQATYVIRVIR